MSGAKVVCWRPHLCGTLQYTVLPILVRVEVYSVREYNTLCHKRPQEYLHVSFSGECLLKLSVIVRIAGGAEFMGGGVIQNP